MTDHIANRDLLVEALRRELVGPAPAGEEIDISREPVVQPSWAQAYGPYRQAGTGEEILTRDAPIKRYGVGVLFPTGASFDEVEALAEEASLSLLPASNDESQDAEAMELGEIPLGNERDSDDFDLSMANAYQPSSLGFSFLMELLEGSKLIVEARGGRYRRVSVSIGTGEGNPRSRTWWARTPVSLRAEFLDGALINERPRKLTAAAARDATYQLVEQSNLQGMDLWVEVYARPRGERESLVTVCLVNRTGLSGRGLPHADCLFQTDLRATVVTPDGDAHILPYPGSHPEGDEEEEGLTLLYRDARTFATGHGCAASWETVPEKERARAVSAACLPVVETPNVTPDIRREDGSLVMVSMAALAGLMPGTDGRADLREVVERYEGWIVDKAIVAGLVSSAERKSIEIEELAGRCEASTSGEPSAAGDAALGGAYRAAAARHLAQCARAATRMRAGLTYLAGDARAWRAFQLANHAVLLQQASTRDAARNVKYDAKDKRLIFDELYQAPDPLKPRPGRGNWRPFQIAFLLASIRSTVESTDPDRELVELIWFPTGGGKTEAYLGLAAFAMFKRRLDDPSDAGVHALMRYTLRLLTAQQFQRASGLICAMELLRSECARELGATPFSIGIWLGSETTPNSRKDALKALDELERSRGQRSPFVLSRCPWCGAAFRRLEIPVGKGKPNGLVLGFARRQLAGASEQTVGFKCPDQACPFSNGLPIYVVDEDIYDTRPTLVIGTIDKFAMLTWRPRARSLFGLDQDGRRFVSPPGLIIQDELHLIAGPLGSLAGLYETTIEDLCTDRRSSAPVLPKIVSSTATIRRYADQIRGLYARRRTALFPPPGLDAGDSFFAHYDRGSRGRVYVGVHAASLGSVQTEWVRAFTALLQAPTAFDNEGRDPWWTLLVFFNSIREMGTAHTLFDSDIRDYANVLWEREGTTRDRRRYLRVVNELTGGLKSDEITSRMADLEVRTTQSRRTPVDVCLASSIIEVGIDIQRLSLMVVAGQPKTTAQYIQVTGRVGRQGDRPGLVVTLYSPSKPRDRSHFERFRAYHEQLYAHVEPTSVTPFSPPALERALHAALVAYARQQGNKALAESPNPFPASVVEQFRRLVLDRAHEADPEEEGQVARVLDKREDEWREWRRTRWEGKGEDPPLLRLAGEYVSQEEKRLSWATLMSMRNVDAECEAEITTRYLTEGGATNA